MHLSKLALSALLSIALVPLALAQKPEAKQILASAKTVYFANQTGSDETGKAAVAQLVKWGKYQIVADKRQADLILLLSSNPHQGEKVLLADGRTGSTSSDGVDIDPYPNYLKSNPPRVACLTAIDPKRNEVLWSDTHPWGGLLTGYNSAGARLVKKLESQIKK